MTVIGAPCDPHWRSPVGIATTGPRYFGYDLDYRPLDAAEPALGALHSGTRLQI